DRPGAGPRSAPLLKGHLSLSGSGNRPASLQRSSRPRQGVLVALPADASLPLLPSRHGRATWSRSRWTPTLPLSGTSPYRHARRVRRLPLAGGGAALAAPPVAQVLLKRLMRGRIEATEVPTGGRHRASATTE